MRLSSRRTSPVTPSPKHLHAYPTSPVWGPYRRIRQTTDVNRCNWSITVWRGCPGKMDWRTVQCHPVNNTPDIPGKNPTNSQSTFVVIVKPSAMMLRGVAVRTSRGNIENSSSVNFAVQNSNNILRYYSINSAVLFRGRSGAVWLGRTNRHFSKSRMS
jgi:hypothetical protein